MYWIIIGLVYICLYLYLYIKNGIFFKIKNHDIEINRLQYRNSFFWFMFSLFYIQYQKTDEKFKNKLSIVICNIAIVWYISYKIKIK